MCLLSEADPKKKDNPPSISLFLVTELGTIEAPKLDDKGKTMTEDKEFKVGSGATVIRTVAVLEKTQVFHGISFSAQKQLPEPRRGVKIAALSQLPSARSTMSIEKRQSSANGRGEYSRRDERQRDSKQGDRKGAWDEGGRPSIQRDKGIAPMFKQQGEIGDGENINLPDDSMGHSIGVYAAVVPLRYKGEGNMVEPFKKIVGPDNLLKGDRGFAGTGGAREKTRTDEAGID